MLNNVPAGLRGKISERAIRNLVSGANSVRQLVRIKIADDNDLEQAKKALLTAINFIKEIGKQAADLNTTPYSLLNEN